MSDTRSLTFNFAGRDTSAGRVMHGLAGDADQASGHFSRLGSVMSGIGRGAAVAGIAAGGAAIYGLGKVFHTGLGEVEDYQAGLSQLQAGLKSTGGVAGISAKGMEDLASKIQDYSGQTDDSIVKTEQLLLTFTNIRNQAGKNNDVFTRTTKIAADMAARMGGDASGAAIQLGKALNDPVKGITALTRVGVSFTDGQKAQIASLVASGNTLKAQKVILGELNTEFGGSAKAMGETLPGKIEIAKRSFEDFAQSAVTAVLPAVMSMLSGLSTGLQKAQPYIAAGIKGIASGLQAFVGFIQTNIVPGVAAFASAMADKIGAVIPVVSAYITGQLIPALKQVAVFIVQDILPVFESWAGFIVSQVIPAIMKIAGPVLSGLRSAFASITAAINDHRQQLAALGHALEAIAGFVLRTLAPVIGTTLRIAFQIVGKTIGVAIDIIAGIVEMFQGIWAAAKKVASFFTGPFLRAIGDMTATFLHAIGDMLDFFLKMSGGILHAAVLMMGWVPGLGGKLKSAEKAFTGWRTSVVDEINRAADAADQIGEHFKVIGAKMAHNFTLGFGSVDIVGPVYDAVHAAGLAAERGARDATESKSPSRVAIRIGEDFTRGLVIGVGKHAKHLYGVAQDLAHGLVDGFGYGLQQLVGKLGGHLQYVLQAVQDKLTAAIDAIHTNVSDRIGKVQAGLAKRLAKIRDVLRSTLDAINSTLSTTLGKINDGLAKTLDRLAAGVDAAKSKLADLVAARDSMASSIASNVGALNLGSLFGTDETGAPTVGNIGEFLSGKLAALRALAQDIKALRAAGLAGPLLSEIVSLPVDQATSIAEQILSGAAGPVGDLNAAQSDITTTSADIGGTVAGSNFDAAIAAQTTVLQQTQAAADAAAAQAKADALAARQEARDEAREQRQQAREEADKAREHARNQADRQIEAIREAGRRQIAAVMALVEALANLPRDANAKDIRQRLLQLKKDIGNLGLA